MGSSRKGHTEKAGKAKAAKPRSLAKRELNVGQAQAVRGGRIDHGDLQIRKLVDKSSA